MKTNLLNELLSGFQADTKSKSPASIQKAIFIARKLQERASALQTPAEKRQQARTNKNWAESDQLRVEIASLGWVVQDSKDGYKLVKIS